MQSKIPMKKLLYTLLLAPLMFGGSLQAAAPDNETRFTLIKFEKSATDAPVYAFIQGNVKEKFIGGTFMQDPKLKEVVSYTQKSSPNLSFDGGQNWGAPFDSDTRLLGKELLVFDHQLQDVYDTKQDVIKIAHDILDPDNGAATIADFTKDNTFVLFKDNTTDKALPLEDFFNQNKNQDSDWQTYAVYGAIGVIGVGALYKIVDIFVLQKGIQEPKATGGKKRKAKSS